VPRLSMSRGSVCAGGVAAATALGSADYLPPTVRAIGIGVVGVATALGVNVGGQTQAPLKKPCGV
jgi:hypothetical protein